jgi:hypothetical protein
MHNACTLRRCMVMPARPHVALQFALGRLSHQAHASSLALSQPSVSMSASHTASTFAVGDTVDVRAHGRAEVIEALVTDRSHKFYGRVRVKYLVDGKTYYARPEALRRLAKAGDAQSQRAAPAAW